MQGTDSGKDPQLPGAGGDRGDLWGPQALGTVPLVDLGSRVRLTLLTAGWRASLAVLFCVCVSSFSFPSHTLPLSSHSI